MTNNDLQRLGELAFIAIASVNNIGKICPSTLATGDIKLAANILSVGLVVSYCLAKDLDLNEEEMVRLGGSTVAEFKEMYCDCVRMVAAASEQIAGGNINPFALISVWVVQRLSNGHEGEGTREAEKYVGTLISNLCLRRKEEKGTLPTSKTVVKHSSEDNEFLREINDFIDHNLSTDFIKGLLKEAGLTSLDYFDRPKTLDGRKLIRDYLKIIKKNKGVLLPDSKAQELAFYVLWYLCGPKMGMARKEYPIESDKSVESNEKRRDCFKTPGLVHKCYEIELKNEYNIFEDYRTEQIGHGLCVDDPIRVKDIQTAYCFLDSLLSPARTPFVHTRSHMTHRAKNGHNIDGYFGHYVDVDEKKKKVTVYIDSYCDVNEFVPPKDWSVCWEKLSTNAETKKGCLLAGLVLFFMIISLGTGVACCLR